MISLLREIEKNTSGQFVARYENTGFDTLNTPRLLNCNLGNGGRREDRATMVLNGSGRLLEQPPDEF